MPTILCLNPGSNSLKFDLVEAHPGQKRAQQGRRIITGAIDNVGRDTSLRITRDDKVLNETKIPAADFEAAVQATLQSLDQLRLPKPDLGVVRVVHGGSGFQTAVEASGEVIQEIEARNELAPLHNPNAVKAINALRKHAGKIRIAAAFDTAFHHTLPEFAWRYPLDVELADRLGIRKFGFHGISHRYQLEQFCYLTKIQCADATIITSHLESGSSLCAIRAGESVETSMGFTPLEGLMMGTRCGSLDPAILPFLMRHENLGAEEALNILEKKSGLLGISGQSLDTRILRKNSDARSRLAMQMYGYRVRAAIGAYLAILGNARAIVFSGGIGENTPEIRWQVLEGLCGFGIKVKKERNDEVMEGDHQISDPSSKVAVWVLHSDEGLQLAHEGVQALQ